MNEAEAKPGEKGDPYPPDFAEEKEDAIFGSKGEEKFGHGHEGQVDEAAAEEIEASPDFKKAEAKPGEEGDSCPVDFASSKRGEKEMRGSSSSLCVERHPQQDMKTDAEGNEGTTQISLKVDNARKWCDVELSEDEKETEAKKAKTQHQKARRHFLLVQSYKDDFEEHIEKVKSMSAKEAKKEKAKVTKSGKYAPLFTLYREYVEGPKQQQWAQSFHDYMKKEIVDQMQFLDPTFAGRRERKGRKGNSELGPTVC